MYNVIKGVISAGGYKLADIQQKIKRFYIRGDLTEAEMDELLSFASVGVSPDAERPEFLTLIQTLAEEVYALKERVLVLEGGNADEETEYPVWKPWDGISKDFQYGAVVYHKGELWESAYNGQNVWEPGTVGTENLWKRKGGD